MPGTHEIASQAAVFPPAPTPAVEWVPDVISDIIDTVHLAKLRVYNFARPPADYSSEEEQGNYLDDDGFDEFMAAHGAQDNSVFDEEESDLQLSASIGQGIPVDFGNDWDYN